MSRDDSKRRDGIERAARDVSRATGLSYDQARQRVADAAARGDRQRQDPRNNRNR